MTLSTFSHAVAQNEHNSMLWLYRFWHGNTECTRWVTRTTPWEPDDWIDGCVSWVLSCLSLSDNRPIDGQQAPFQSSAVCWHVSHVAATKIAISTWFSLGPAAYLQLYRKLLAKNSPGNRHKTYRSFRRWSTFLRACCALSICAM